jgi:hypothetical protein
MLSVLLLLVLMVFSLVLSIYENKFIVKGDLARPEIIRGATKQITFLLFRWAVKIATLGLCWWVLGWRAVIVVAVLIWAVGAVVFRSAYKREVVSTAREAVEGGLTAEEAIEFAEETIRENIAGKSGMFRV